jgi:hypothetical protein
MNGKSAPLVWNREETNRPGEVKWDRTELHQLVCETRNCADARMCQERMTALALDRVAQPAKLPEGLRPVEVAGKMSE